MIKLIRKESLAYQESRQKMHSLARNKVVVEQNRFQTTAFGLH